MVEQMDAHNEISGTVVGNVIQGRDVTVSLPVTPPVAVSGLPPQPVFVGRATELAQLANLLNPTGDEIRDGRVVVSAVAGLAGVGKTALAVRAAHDAVAAGWFPGGALMVDLRGYDPPDRRVQPTAALVNLLNAIGTPSKHIPVDQADRERLWRSLLANRDATGQRMLIVLDNASAAEQVRSLLPGPTGHQVVITSRHSLADLDGARLFELDVLPAEHAVTLLQQALTAAHSDDTRVRADPRCAHQLAQLCGGLPLALRIAAALLSADPDQPIAELTEALTAEQHRLEELNYAGSLTVRAAFDLSYNHLAHAAARLLRMLALNPGPEINTDAAAALANVGTTETRRLIGELRRAHLVQPGTARGRWRMHDLLRLYAAEQVQKDDGRGPAIDRLLRYYVATSKAASSQLDGRIAVVERDQRFTGRQSALDWLDVEHPNLVGAVTLAYDAGHYGHTLALSNGLYEFFRLRLHVSDWLATHRTALEAARSLDDRHGQADVHIQLGLAFWHLRLYPKAAHHHQRAAETYRQLGDRHGEANAVLRLGITYRCMYWHDDAMGCYRQALAAYRAVGDRRGEARALNNIGVRYADAEVSQPEEAERHYRQALQLCLEEGYREGEAGELGNLGTLYTDLGRWDDALRYHREALEI